MTFKPDEIEAFKAVFSESAPHILRFEGCRDVQLLQDLRHPEIMMTYSIWDSESHLNAYRASDFFQSTWARTKKLFAEKAEAWSLDQITPE